MTGKRNGYQIADFDEMSNGLIEPPNYEEVSLDDGLMVIGGRTTLHGLPFVRRIRAPEHTNLIAPARYFLDHTQNDLLDGSGYVIWYGAGLAHIGKFAICQHQKKEGRDANPIRGWHPGECDLCGLDMTVDSSG